MQNQPLHFSSRMVRRRQMKNGIRMTLASLSQADQVAAILTASDEAIYTAANTIRSRRRTVPGGRPKKTQLCPTCGLELGSREMRAHKCPQTAAALATAKTAATPALQSKNQ